MAWQRPSGEITAGKEGAAPGSQRDSGQTGTGGIHTGTSSDDMRGFQDLTHFSVSQNGTEVG